MFCWSSKATTKSSHSENTFSDGTRFCDGIEEPTIEELDGELDGAFIPEQRGANFERG